MARGITLCTTSYKPSYISNFGSQKVLVNWFRSLSFTSKCKSILLWNTLGYWLGTFLGILRRLELFMFWETRSPSVKSLLTLIYTLTLASIPLTSLWLWSIPLKTRKKKCMLTCTWHVNAAINHELFSIHFTQTTQCWPWFLK